MNNYNETQVIKPEVNKLNVPDNNCCSYCKKQFTEELWCKDCDPFRIIEGWTSGNPDIDKFIKDIMYSARQDKYSILEWVPFDRFMNIKQIGEGGFAKVYTATWMDGPLSERLERQNDGSWKKIRSQTYKSCFEKVKWIAEYFSGIS